MSSPKIQIKLVRVSKPPTKNKKFEIIPDNRHTHFLDEKNKIPVSNPDGGSSFPKGSSNLNGFPAEKNV